MKILAMEKEIPGVAPERFKPLLIPEARRVWELYQAGVIREIYFRDDRDGAVLILECRDRVDAEQVLGTLPLVRENLIAFDIISLKPYPGLARLFAAE